MHSEVLLGVYYYISNAKIYPIQMQQSFTSFISNWHKQMQQNPQGNQMSRGSELDNSQPTSLGLWAASSALVRPLVTSKSKVLDI